MNKDGTLFHLKHESFTDLAYQDGNILPDRYVFVLTNQCNLRCHFCFQDKEKSSTNLTTEQWLDFIEELPDYSRVTFTGGEPFLYEGFETIFKKVAEKFPCNVISNGLLLTDEIINLLLSYDNFKVLSISLEDRYNKNRGVSIKKWEQTEKQIKKFVELKRLKSSNTILDIKTVILDDNADSLFDMYSYAKNELECDTHAFQFLKGSPLQHSDKMYDESVMFEKTLAYKYKKFETIIEQLKKIALLNPENRFVHPKLLHISIQEDFLTSHILNEQSLDKDLYQKCKFPWSSVHINYDGSLYPCISISMGNIKELSLKEIIFGEKFMIFKKLIKEEGLVEACNRCGWLRLKK